MALYKRKIQINRLPQLGGDQWSLDNLTDVTIILGKNGSGKSVLLRGWRDINPEGVHYIAPERTGEMDFQPQFLQEELDASKRKAASVRNWVPEYRRRIISRVQTYFITRGNVRGRIPPCDPEEIEELLSSLVPDFTVRLKAENPPYELKRIENGEIISRVDQLSSGEAQLITLGLDILTMAGIWEVNDSKERIILLDEPDAHIHPDLEVRFADFLTRIIDQYKLQIVIATHSTSLMSAIGQFAGERSSIIYLQRTRTDYLAKKFTTTIKEIAACLGGHVLMGPLFGAPLLLVEGDDDYRIWSQVPRHHVLNLAVIPTNGDEIRNYQKSLEQIFESLRNESTSPIGYALLDGDKALPTPNPQNPQRHIRFIRLACHEAENLYLTNEVLKELGITWNEAKNKIQQLSKKFGAKADILSNIKKWDRKSDDIKNVINELSYILDPKPIHWTVRVGTVIGRQKPTGQLADFLGPQVIDALWSTQGN